MEIIKKKFGEKSTLFTLKNNHGVELSVTDFGARIVSLKVPVDGELRETVLGFDSENEYREADTYIGATIGRFAGRIKNGVFEMAGEKIQTAVDPETGHTLHGGAGFDKLIWTAVSAEAADDVSVVFSLTSPAGSNGFPGNLKVKVAYRLTNSNEWIIDYTAEADELTIYNPTNHVYFNLTGDPCRPIDEHKLALQSEHYIEVDEHVIPTGKILNVKETMFDFTGGKKLAEMFAQAADQKSGIDGLDHPFLLEKGQPQATLVSPDEKIKVELTTDDPAVVIFTANFGAEGPVMRGRKLVHHGGITLETQVPPGVTDYPEWGNVTLRPDEEMNKQTIFKLIF